MRNVNFYIFLSNLNLRYSFILTMRNVNGTDNVSVRSTMHCFILTMRNVNEQSVPASEPNGG